MKTEKQRELIDGFLSGLEGQARPLYREITAYLSALGYHPHKERSNISFKHDLHNKQMAKMGVRGNRGNAPFFALRFSACKGYSQRFADVVGTTIGKYPTRAAHCMDGGCGHCGGKAATHIYLCESGDGDKTHCGAYALEIPHITMEDLEEIKNLIREEHEYLMRHEAGRAS